jgi:hypothetical protein
VSVRAALLIVSLLVLPEIALGARIVAVRVGVHAGYGRVVLETDAAAAYELVGSPDAAPGEVTVRIAATSRARQATSSIEGAPAVALVPQDDGSTLAMIRASGPLRVETQVLSAPPRVVLDLHRVAADAAPSPAPVAEAEPAAPAAAPEAIPNPIAEPAPTPTQPPVVATPEPPVAAPPAEEEATPLPPVGAAPPPVSAPARSNAVDTPSLAVGIAVGLGLAFFGFASRRRSRAAARPASVEAFESLPPPLEAAELSPHELENITPFPRREPLPTAAWFESLPEPRPELPETTFPRSEPQASGEVHDIDLLRMHQRLDARLAEIAGRLGDLVERQATLEARGAAQSEEIASQRAAIARLQRSLRPAATQTRPLQVP